MGGFTIFLIITLVLIFSIIGIYNSLIAKRNQVANIASSVDTQLKKRYDLIPNLVTTLKAYLTHEREVLTKISTLRSEAMNTTSNTQKFALNAELSRILGSLKIAVENYPELKANENVLHLQATLSEVEEQISAARRAYNGAVMVYNNACEMFPTNLIASFFHFKKSEFFAADESEKRTPNLSEMLK
ncbi:LemA family protein [Campylobacter sp. VBCF_05 NA6]|uniref:LemA family protein n=1 Tax=unclassified Campylobacter TaxID=2593542 RepID=UPI0022E9CEDB|nr:MULTISPECIES: LemA family protein [unclassified Campylobacter]MDA3057252.1 LemA family protein [Campylobacter sp. VBCF_04 NA7]MDA3059176.1 LemA family protein [Campylobacter sp. VBCF_05 NA6]